MKKSFLIFSALILSLSMWATTYTLEPGEDKIGGVISTLADGDVIELQTGTYTEWHSLTFTTKVTIQAAEGASPKLALYNWKIQNDFEINGVEITNVSTDNYLFRVYAEVAGTVAFKNCSMQCNAGEITTTTPYVLLEKGVGTLTIDNCIFKDNAKSQGSIVYAGSYAITNFSMTNSTAINCAKQSVYCTALANALVDHCTFYNCNTETLYLKGTNIAVKNCIFANASNVSGNCIKTYAGTVDHCIYYNCSAGPRSDDASVDATTCVNANPQFTDPDNGNFQLKANSPAVNFGTDGETIGDLRWGVAPRETKIAVEPGTGKLNAAIAAAQAGDTLILSTGVYTENNTITLDKQITLLAAEGATPELYIAKICPNAAFEANGLEIYLNGDDYLFRTTTGGDFSIIFRNCVLRDCKSIFYYLSDSQTISNLIIDNCIFKNNSVRPENGVIYGCGTITNFEMRNSTVYNISGKYAVRVRYSTNAIIDHCTFYNCGTQPILVGEKSCGAIAISNVVVSNPELVAGDAITPYDGTLTNCVYYNTEGINWRAEKCINADPQFIDAANDNFNFPITSPLFAAATDGAHIGDPRWTVEGLGEGIDLPAVLNKANVTTVHPDMTYYENDYFDFGPDGDSDYSARWAGWIVNIAKGKFVVEAEAVAPSGYQLQVEIINPTTGEIVSTKLAEYQKDSIGEMDLNELPAGQYFVRFKNVTTWSQVKARNLTFTQIGGIPVDMPATLLPDEEHLMLSAKASIDNDSILFSPRGSEGLNPDNWAKWNINVTEKATYSFVANTCVAVGVAGNGWQYQLTILNGKDTVYTKATEAIWSNGDVANDMGSVVLEPGIYTLMIQNIMANSKGRLLSVEVEKEYLSVEVKDDAEDNSVLVANEGQKVNVALTRSLADGMFNTICLPFALSADQIAASPLAGAEIYMLDYTVLKDDEVELDFTASSSIEAGVPYIIQPVAEVVNPSFEGVTIALSEPSATEAEHATFKGIFIQTHLTAGNENLLYLGQNNTLYFPPVGDESKMKGLRGYFEILQDANAPIRRASIHMGTNVVTTLDLVDGKAIPNGLFMFNGQIEIRVNGQKYMLNGMQK